MWCCVDKEGILSLPNPCAEKVFFLKSRKQKLKEELGGRKKERKESEGTWTSDASKVSSSQDGQESSEDEEEDTEVDDDDEVCIDSAGGLQNNLFDIASSVNVFCVNANYSSKFQTKSLISLFFTGENWKNYLKGHKEVLSLSSDPEVCSLWFKASIEKNIVWYFCIVHNLTGRCTVYNSVCVRSEFKGGFLQFFVDPNCRVNLESDLMI